jgi:hypothetical protein
MTELIMMMAKLLPEKELIDELEKYLIDYKADPSKENKDKLTLNCMMVAGRFATEGKGTEEVVSGIAENRRILKAHEFQRQ